MEKHFIIGLYITVLCLVVNINSEELETESRVRGNKALPVFQVVKFPNDICIINKGSKNGTCYTSEECSNKGGTNGGSCASGFGVCCVFTVGCGGSSSENCTYFEVTGANNGPCVASICKADSNICQVRLDLNTFVITGPQTSTASIGKGITQHLTIAQATKINQIGNCLTDRFTVSGTKVPSLCSTLTGEHIYFDASQECHNLDFSLGQNAVGNSKPTSRNWSIKVSQISCNDYNKAPPGCLQYFYGKTTVGTVTSFNYSNGQKIQPMNQVICFRREQGYCKTCFSGATTDVQLGAKNSKRIVKGEVCCGYGSKGTKTTGGDCINIPHLTHVTKGTHKLSAMCGGKGGLGTTSGTTHKTVCTKSQPFRIEWLADSIDYAAAASGGAVKGFSLKYWQVSC